MGGGGNAGCFAIMETRHTVSESRPSLNFF